MDAGMPGASKPLPLFSAKPWPHETPICAKRIFLFPTKSTVRKGNMQVQKIWIDLNKKKVDGGAFEDVDHFFAPDGPQKKIPLKTHYFSIVLKFPTRMHLLGDFPLSSLPQQKHVAFACIVAPDRGENGPCTWQKPAGHDFLGLQGAVLWHIMWVMECWPHMVALGTVRQLTIGQKPVICTGEGRKVIGVHFPIQKPGCKE